MRSGEEADSDAIHEAIYAGVHIFATVHGQSIKEIAARPVLKELLQEKVFTRIVLLSRRKAPERWKAFLINFLSGWIQGKGQKAGNVMLKVLGAVLILMATSKLGFDSARQLRKRPRQIQELRSGLAILKTEINYGTGRSPRHSNALPKRQAAN